MITKEQLKHLLHYDEKTGIFTWINPRSKKIKIGTVAGNKNAEGYIKINIRPKIYFAHRLAWLYVYGKWPAEVIDHINGNPSDNSIKNLRHINRSQNSLNRKVSKNNISGTKGVSWNTEMQKWTVQLTVNGKNKYFGTFEDLEFASLLANELKEKYHKEFARKI